MIRNLSELCNIQYGYAFDSASFTDDASYMPLVRIRDVKRGYSETYYSGAYSDEYIIRAGDLLVGMDGEFNIAKWKSRDALLNQRVCKIIAKKETDGEYLRFVLSVALKIIEERTAFVTVKHLSAKELNKIKIQAPSYEEQKNIAVILLRIEKIIQAKQDELRKLDNLIKARFVEMFGSTNNEQVKIAELVEQKISTAKKDFEGDAEIKYIDISSINNRRNTMTGFTKYKMSNAPSRARQHVQFGDIIISTVRPNLKNVAMVSMDSDNLVASSGFCVLRPKKCTSEFLMAIVCSDRFTDAMVNVVTGANYPAIKNSDVLNYCVPLLSEEQQRQFANFVTQVDKSKFAVQKSLEKTQLLFDSLMQEYFG